jgi:hypothetical protein
MVNKPDGAERLHNTIRYICVLVSVLIFGCRTHIHVTLHGTWSRD